MDSIDIVRYRLAAQQLASPKFKTVRKLVHHFGAMQAQDYPGALWEIALRLPDRQAGIPGAKSADVERAIERKEIVRYWPMRGTIHFTDADDIRWMLALSAERMIRGSTSYVRKEGLDEAVFKKCRTIFSRALGGGKALTRDELRDALTRGGVPSGGQRGYHIIWRMSYEGLTCFGPHRGKQATFVLLDEWLPHTTLLKRADALTELAKRYFSGHGPASIKDFCWWAGLTVADAKAGIAASGMVQKDFGGKALFMLRSAKPAVLATGGPHAHLLPPFDEFLIAFKDRSASLDPAHSLMHQPGNNGMFLGVAIVDGMARALWRKTIKRDRVVVDFKQLHRLSAVEQGALKAAAQRYGDYLGLRAELA